MRHERLRALAESIRAMEPGAAATLGPDRDRIPEAEAGTDGPLPELFGMNVWFVPHKDDALQNVMGIAGCAVRKWSGEAAAHARNGMIDLVEAAGTVLSLDEETAWTLLSGRFTAPKGMTGNVALVMTTRDDAATACERVFDGAAGPDIWKHVRDRLAGKVGRNVGRERTRSNGRR